MATVPREYREGLDQSLQNTFDTLRIEKYAQQAVDILENKGYEVESAILLGSGAYGMSHLADSSVIMDRTDGEFDINYQEASDIDMIITLSESEGNYIDVVEQFYRNVDGENVEGPINDIIPQVEINPRIIYHNELPGKLKNSIRELRVEEEEREDITLPSVDGKPVDKSSEEFLGYFMQGFKVLKDNDGRDYDSEGTIEYITSDDEQFNLGELSASGMIEWAKETAICLGVSPSPDLDEDLEGTVWENIKGRIEHKESTLEENYQRACAARSERKFEHLRLRNEDPYQGDRTVSKRRNPFSLKSARKEVREGLKEALVGEHGDYGSIESLMTGEFRDPFKSPEFDLVNGEEFEVDPSEEVVRRRVKRIFDNHPDIEKVETGEGKVYRAGPVDIEEEELFELARGAAKRKLGKEKSSEGGDNAADQQKTFEDVKQDLERKADI